MWRGLLSLHLGDRLNPLGPKNPRSRRPPVWFFPIFPPSSRTIPGTGRSIPASPLSTSVASTLLAPVQPLASISPQCLWSFLLGVDRGNIFAEKKDVKRREVWRPGTDQFGSHKSRDIKQAEFHPRLVLATSLSFQLLPPLSSSSAVLDLGQWGPFLHSHNSIYLSPSSPLVQICLLWSRLFVPPPLNPETGGSGCL